MLSSSLRKIVTLLSTIGFAVVGACEQAEPFRANGVFSSEEDSGSHETSSGSGGSTGTGGTGGSSGSGGSLGSGGSYGSGGSSGSGGSFGSGGASGGSGGGSGSGGASGGPGGSGGSVVPDAGSGGGTGSGGASGSGGATGSGGGSGSGGSGGSTVNGCDRANWTFAVNVYCDTTNCTNIPASQKEPRYAVDGDAVSRYTSGRPQGSAGAETATLTFPRSVSLTGIKLFTSAPGDGPAAYRLDYATSGTNFAAFSPAIAGTGSDNLTINFPATTMQAIRVTQTGSKAAPWWSIHELTLLGCTNN